MKEKLIRFMQGRYGVDQLSKFLMVIGLVFILANSFVSTGTLYFLSLVTIFYAYYRVFSKNHGKRYRENQWYLNYHNKVLGIIGQKKHMMKQRKHYRIYKCTTCKQKIRVPKGKGKIMIRCPKCNNEFLKKS